MTGFRITPLGTCRIHTPLTRAVGRYPIELDQRRNYGFVHTSEEVLQQLRFLQSEQAFRSEVMPLVIRGDVERLAAEDWAPADYHIVEISSAKRSTCMGEVVQANYVQRHFADFFANTERARRFWKRVRKGHRQDLVDWLERQPTYHLLSATDRELLAGLSITQQTFRELKSDMTEIVERLGRDRVLFVSHVNAVDADGAAIPARARLIRWVGLAAEQLEASFFEPTKAMMAFRQERAMERNGLDLTHYTPAFSDRLYDVIHQEYIAPLFGSRIETDADERTREVAALTSKIETMIAGDEFFTGARELHAAIERFPEAVALKRLRGVVRSRIGDFRGVTDDLMPGWEDRTATPLMRQALAEASAALGEHRTALDLAEALIDEEAENADLYRMASASAEALGDAELAIRYAKQVYRLDRSDLAAALRALVLVAAAGNPVEVDEWRTEILDHVDQVSTGMFEICDWAVRNGDEALFAATLPAVAAVDKAGSLDLMEEALASDDSGMLVASFPVAIKLGRLSPEYNGRRLAVFNGALERAHDLADQGAVGDAYALAEAIAALAGATSTQIPITKLSRSAAKLMRHLSSDIRNGIRDAFAAGDYAAVVTLGKRLPEMIVADQRSAILLARALQAVGRPADALEALDAVPADHRGDFLIRRWTARIAVAAKDYATALEHYGSLRDSGDPRVDSIKAELDRFFATAEARSLKELSLLARRGSYDEALVLATMIERHFGPLERTERELNRMHKSLRVRLRELENEDGEPEEREAVMRQILAVRPEDAPTLRRLALHLMRQFRFAEAAEYWDRLLAVDPGNEIADRNRIRCATLAQRRSTNSAQVADFAG